MLVFMVVVFCLLFQVLVFVIILPIIQNIIGNPPTKVSKNHLFNEFANGIVISIQCRNISFCHSLRFLQLIDTQAL